MLFLNRYEVAIATLERRWDKKYLDYWTPGRAYRYLKSRSGEDFGYDVEAWKRWLEETDPYDNGGKFYWNGYTARQTDDTSPEKTDSVNVDTPQEEVNEEIEKSQKKPDGDFWWSNF